MKPLFLTMMGDSDFNAMSLQNGDYKSYEMEFSEMAENKGTRITSIMIRSVNVANKRVAAIVISSGA